MPKASLDPEKAKQGGAGIEAGNYEVTASRFQNLKSDYKANQLHLVLDLVVLDKDGDPVRGADPIDLHVSFGEKSLEAFHPGNGSSADDTDPTDQGDGVDAEGNTIYCIADGQFNRSCGAMVFMETLGKAGFPKQVLDACWAPAFIGLKFTLDSLTPKEINARFGTRLNMKPMADRKTGEQINITYKVVDKWLNPSYLSSGTGKPNVKVATAAAPKATDPADIAKAVLALVAAKKSGPKNTIKSKQALVGFYTNEFTKAKYPQSQLAASQALIKDDAFLQDAVAELGGMHEDGVTTFFVDDAAA